MPPLVPEPSTGSSTYERPADTPPALFLPRSGGVSATELTRGPWAHRVMHGGPITGLLGWAVERALQRPDLVCTRLTVDIFHDEVAATEPEKLLVVAICLAAALMMVAL